MENTQHVRALIAKAVERGCLKLCRPVDPSMTTLDLLWLVYGSEQKTCGGHPEINNLNDLIRAYGVR